MKWFFVRLFRKLWPLSAVQRRRQTEEVIRGMYERQNGRRLDDEFRKIGMEKHEVDVLFDEIDLRYGAALGSLEPKRAGQALNAAVMMVAGFVMEKQSFNS